MSADSLPLLLRALTLTTIAREHENARVTSGGRESVTAATCNT